MNKNALTTDFAFDAPMVWNDLPDEVHSAPTLTYFRKAKFISLQTGFPSLAFTLGVSGILDFFFFLFFFNFERFIFFCDETTITLILGVHTPW